MPVERFLSPPSARRATCIGRLPHRHNRDFYPRPPRGGRPTFFTRVVKRVKFLSPPSARRATPTDEADVLQQLDFYPRPPRGGRRRHKRGIQADFGISIPALREEGDADHHPRWSYCNISIPALREEGDHICVGKRGEVWDFYPRPPRGGRRHRERNQCDGSYFYPRPPRGGRPKDILMGLPLKEFLSPPSARRATVAGQVELFDQVDFYPRPPRGGRQGQRR